jgi:hypothetical protein
VSTMDALEIRIKSLEDTADDHEERLRALSRWVYLAMGGLTVLNSLGIWKYISLGGGK